MQTMRVLPTIHDSHLLRLKRTAVFPSRRGRRLLRRRNSRHARGMLEFLLPPTVLATEAERSGEDGPAALPGLNGAGRKAPAVAHALDMIDDGDLRVAGEDEVAVHAMDGEIAGHGALGGGQGLGDGGAAVDAARAGGMPEGARIREDVL